MDKGPGPRQNCATDQASDPSFHRRLPGRHRLLSVYRTRTTIAIWSVAPLTEYGTCNFFTDSLPQIVFTGKTLNIGNFLPRPQGIEILVRYWLNKTRMAIVLEKKREGENGYESNDGNVTEFLLSFPFPSLPQRSRFKCNSHSRHDPILGRKV